MVDSSSWTIPESESGGFLEEFFVEVKNKMATSDNCKIMFWAISLLLSQLKNTICKESNNDKVKVLCMTRFQDGRHINMQSDVMQSFHF